MPSSPCGLSPRSAKVALSLVLFVATACTSSDDPLAIGADGGSPPTSPSGSSGPGAPEPSPTKTEGETAGFKYAFTPSSVAIACGDSAAKLLASGAAKVTFGDSTILAGYAQVSANEQDPIVARIDGGSVVFCEHTKKGGGPDARAYGITWDGRDTLYGVFTVVGGGTSFDAASKDGWVPSYGNGGASAKVMVVGKLDPKTGKLERATFVPSRLVKDGQTKTNTLTPADAVHVRPDGSLEIFGNAAYCSLNPDRTSMCNAGGQDYPKGYRARLTADLRQMLCASASGVSNVTTPCD
jgi:hypothetical protein